MADTKISALTALAGADSAAADLVPVVDTSATETKKMTLAEFFAAWAAAVTTELAGASVAATDEFLISDAGVAKTITAAELFAAWPAAISTELEGSSAATTDELLISDGGVPKTITLTELFSALAILGLPLADIPEYADQAAAQAGLSGTGKLFRFATTGALGVTIA